MSHTDSPQTVYTVKQFCAAERISRAHIYSLWRQGRGPAYYRIGNSTHRRITEQARQDWHRHLEAETATHAAAATTLVTTPKPDRGGE